MKKIYRIIVICAVFLHVLVFSGLANPYPSFHVLSFDLVSHSLKSPEEISMLLQDQFRVEKDKELFGQSEYWQSPLEFWMNKAGDCEDYALMSDYLLQILGYESYVISIYGRRYAHTVTIYKDKNTKQFFIINMGKLISQPSANLEEAIGRVHSSWKWAAIAEADNGNGKLIKKIRNQRAASAEFQLLSPAQYFVSLIARNML